jgi:multisubunit Na+/H+ antiporter MnhG subunit
MLRDLAIDALLWLGVATAVLSCLGVLVMRTPLQRLHYLGPLAMVAPMLIGVAVALGRNTYAGAGYKSVFIALLIAAFAPVLSHQLGRMASARPEAER